RPICGGAAAASVGGSNATRLSGARYRRSAFGKAISVKRYSRDVAGRGGKGQPEAASAENRKRPGRKPVGAGSTARLRRQNPNHREPGGRGKREARVERRI